MRQEIFMCAKIRYYDGVTDIVEVNEPCFIYEALWQTPAEICAGVIACTRNIAAMWDVIEVQIMFAPAYTEVVDVTESVKDAYDKMYVSRRKEFQALMK